MAMANNDQLQLAGERDDERESEQHAVRNALVSTNYLLAYTVSGRCTSTTCRPQITLAQQYARAREIEFSKYLENEPGRRCNHLAQKKTALVPTIANR
jgi:hypothetical protein